MKNSQTDACATQVRRCLSLLGLAFRVEQADFSADSWKLLLEKAKIVADSLVERRPDNPAAWVYVETVNEPPDANGWITGVRRVSNPYWIPKACLDELEALEQLLNDLPSRSSE
ncbi:hypothetical protein [Cupriavidus neocaledonicus]|nr:hypothetical protein [Cupriavidus neocaledonicus]